ncbi:MAG: hypothetical protein ACE5EQ_07975 [Phycisphaerae bacterium]
MGLFWDLIQQSQISNQKAQSADLNTRVQRLEDELLQTRQLLHTLVSRMEQHFGEDLNQDGRIG